MYILFLPSTICIDYNIYCIYILSTIPTIQIRLLYLDSIGNTRYIVFLQGLTQLEVIVVLAVACGLVGGKPLTEGVLIKWQRFAKELTLMKLYSKFQILYSRKCIGRGLQISKNKHFLGCKDGAQIVMAISLTLRKCCIFHKGACTSMNIRLL